jgi:hypothetical protein
MLIHQEVYLNFSWGCGNNRVLTCKHASPCPVSWQTGMRFLVHINSMIILVVYRNVYRRK